MKIAVACDHGGYEFKKKLHEYLEKKGHEVKNFGCDSTESCDYPDHAIPAIQSVVEGETERGILVCTNGLGMCIVANKFPGIRATLVYNEKTAYMSRRHNNANVLCLGGKMFPHEDLLKFVEIWLETDFEDGGRHARRMGKIDRLDTELRKA